MAHLFFLIYTLIIPFWKYNPAVTDQVFRILTETSSYPITDKMVQTRILLLAAAVGLPVLAEEAAACTKIIRAVAGDTCANLSDKYGITVQQFVNYNPTLRTCTLDATYAYCVSQNPADGPPKEIPAGPGGTVLIPSPDGSDGVCGGEYTCLGSVYGDCCSIVGYCGNSTDYCGERCNPAFGRCGGGTEPGTEPNPDTTTACVPGATLTVTVTKFVTVGGGSSSTTTTIRGPDRPTTTTTTTTTRRTTTTTTTTTRRTTTTTTSSRPSPTVSGTSARCTKYHLVTARDNCDRLEELYGIDDGKIDQLNPNYDCLQPRNFVGQYICVAGPN